MTEQPNFEPAHKDMGHHIVSGIINSGIVQAVKLLCQFGSVIILSRLLQPSDFGLLAMTGPIYGFVLLFQDFGLSQATVQKSLLNHDEVNAFFWINVAVGTALTATILAISPLAGWYYHEPRAVALTAAMGLLILVGSTGNQPAAILTRRMEFGILSLIGALGAMIGLVVSIVMAFFIKGYWALYFGMIASNVIPVVGVWLAARWRPTWPRRVAGLRAMLKFGAGVTTFNIAGFFTGNMDNVLIGHRWGDYPLGLYDRAYKLLLFPLQRITGPVMGTMVPVLSRLSDDPGRYRHIFLRTVAQLTFATWPGIIWATALSDTLVPVLLGKQWTDSAAIFRPLALAGLLQVVNGSISCLLVSQGRSGELARMSIVWAIICVAGFFIGLPYGPIGVAGAYAICQILLTPGAWWYTARRGPVGARDVIRVIVPQVGSGIVAALALLIYRTLDAPPIILLAGGLFVSYAAAAITLAFFPNGRETLRHTWDAALRIVRHVMPKTETPV